ncbi:MAG TPA: glycoside hydrolase family 3 N-terminal domain-containing protein [Candidatus Hydrogenedentes bacterium]|nr:glycoside hydrolase family 3 N-terminal domain-containing protein [Candidatus Hydrogenedentota bacterium]
MKKLYIHAIVLLAAGSYLALFSAHAQPSAFYPEQITPAEVTKPAPSDQTSSSSGTAEPAEDPVEAFIRNRSLQQRIAQLMIVTLEGESRLLLGDVTYLKSFSPGGILLARSLNPSTALSYVQSVRSFEAVSGAPFLIGADLFALTQPTRSLPSQFIQLPTPLSVLATSSPDIFQDYSALLALYTESLGFNFYPGPALDLSPPFKTAADTVLTLGSDPVKAAGIASCFQNAFAGTRTAWMPMGFPGGGANREGRSAAVLTTPLSALLEQDGLPYRQVIEQGAGIIHVGNVLVPTLDTSSPPASLSKQVMTDLLRHQLNFQGVIAAGPLDEALIQAETDPAVSAVMALLAGADMLLWQSNLVQPEKAIKRIAAAVTDGTLSEERINDSVHRVLRLKMNLAQATPAQLTSKNKRVDLKKLGEWSVKVERHAATLIKNQGNALPLVKDGGAPVGITGVVGVEELYQLLEKEVKRLVRQSITSARHVGDIERFEIDRLTRNMKALGTIVVILTDRVRFESQIELLRALKQNGAKLVVLFLGDPRNACRLQEADSILLSYCNSNATLQAMQALAPVLMGKSPLRFRDFPDEIRVKAGEERSFDSKEILCSPVGRLPIALSDQYPAGFSLSMDPGPAIKKVEWFFDGKRIKKDKVAFTFSTPGKHTVSVTVTDMFKTEQSREIPFYAE